MTEKWKRIIHGAVTAGFAVLFLMVGIAYGGSWWKTQKPVDFFDHGLAQYGPGNATDSAYFFVEFNLPFGGFYATYPVDASIRLELFFESSFDIDRTFYLWYEHLGFEAVHVLDSSGSWIEIDYKKGQELIEIQTTVVFHYEGVYAFNLVEKGNRSFRLAAEDFDTAKVISVGSVEAGTGQYFNNLIFGLGLASAGFAGVPLFSSLIWTLTHAKIGETPRETESGRR